MLASARFVLTFLMGAAGSGWSFRDSFSSVASNNNCLQMATFVQLPYIRIEAIAWQSLRNKQLYNMSSLGTPISIIDRVWINNDFF
jgi:hypothetical protein